MVIASVSPWAQWTPHHHGMRAPPATPQEQFANAIEDAQDAVADTVHSTAVALNLAAHPSPAEDVLSYFCIVLPILAFLSPMVNNGAHLAFAVYSGAGTAATTALTGQIYATTYPGDLSFPIITELYPAKALAAVRAVLAASFDVAALDTDALLASADGFLVLNVLVGLIKPFVSGAAVLLSYQDLVTKNVPAWKLGGNQGFEVTTFLREQGRTETETESTAGEGGLQTNPAKVSV